MNIVSHDGPGREGAISTALERMHKSGGRNQTWWYLAQDQIKCLSKSAVRHIASETIPAPVGDSHYRFCYEFIWPVMHGLTDQVTYVEEDFFLFKRHNAIFAAQIERQQSHAPYFVQNYQLALLPKFLKNDGRESAMFWQIPWPSSVCSEHLPAVIEIAQSLLKAKAIAFTTQEYADNFNNFVDCHLPFINSSRAFGHVAEVIVAPLGIDLEHWTTRELTEANDVAGEITTPYVLSIEKADLSAGTMQRLKAIDLFFARHPELQEKITFVQVISRSNPGIKAFDKYWKDCQDQINSLIEKYATDSWQPLVSITQGLNSDQMAQLYRQAAVLLVTSSAGYNLAAKEYLACQTKENPGIVAISTGAGVAEEIGRYAITFNSDDIDAIADATMRCIMMPTPMRLRRHLRLKQLLQQNTLEIWCGTFSKLMCSDQAEIAEVG